MSEAGLTTVITVPCFAAPHEAFNQAERSNDFSELLRIGPVVHVLRVYNPGPAASGPRELHVGCRDIVSRGQAPHWHSGRSCWQLARLTDREPSEDE